jgi:hypothetical protein
MEGEAELDRRDNDKMSRHAAASTGLNLFGNFTERTVSTASSTSYPYDAHCILVLG